MKSAPTSGGPVRSLSVDRTKFLSFQPDTFSANGSVARRTLDATESYEGTTCSYTPGLAAMRVQHDYCLRFGPLPGWAAGLHLARRKRLCALAMDRDQPLPDRDPKQCWQLVHIDPVAGWRLQPVPPRAEWHQPPEPRKQAAAGQVS